MKYALIRRPHLPILCAIIIERKFLRRDMILHTRDDKTGVWSKKNLGGPPASLPPVRQIAAPPLPAEHSAVAPVKSSIVRIKVFSPVGHSGYYSPISHQCGIVINVEKGFILTHRSTLPTDLCDLFVIITDSITVRAKTVYMHPLGIAIIQYDASLVEVEIKAPTFSHEPIRDHQKTILHGFAPSTDRFHTVETNVKDIESIEAAYLSYPHYQLINLEVIHL